MLLNVMVGHYYLNRDQLDSFVVALTKPEMVTAGSDVETQIIVTEQPEETLNLNYSGQYVCALYILESEDKWYGKVIYNITVTVQDNRELNNTNQTTPDLTILYVVGGLLLMCLFVTVIVMRKKTKNSQAKHQTLRMNGNQDGAETLECSPYAVGRGDQDPHSRTKHPEVRDHVTLQNEADGHPSAELYSVVMISPEYEAIDNIGTQT
ncbi:hypothetical protein DPEC_G00347580 [Dallia pectoralis]|uniref:Uncharacterized protein n=1 Tax=Dallia pectoralis TaxID=75939 RepID=A0ACC2F426_DALPE|nr:hypothetical protein DPEC_G00347580 [Dallia pectoralis]